MTPFETLLRTNMEVLTYVIFFGLLIALGALEFFSRCGEKAQTGPAAGPPISG